MPTPICQACGCKMRTRSDYPRGNFSSEFCVKCLDPKGNIKSKEIIRINMIRCRVNELGMDQEEAVEVVDNLMKSLPFWRKKAVESI
ncbi:MAG: zinc ribbon domain-containing protein [Candidatus Zixiibacteriota bacterium]